MHSRVVLHCCVQLDTADIATFHRFKSEAATDPTGLKARVQKVTSEIAGTRCFTLADVQDSHVGCGRWLMAVFHQLIVAPAVLMCQVVIEACALLAVLLSVELPAEQ
jgi:hypothetical protein